MRAAGKISSGGAYREDFSMPAKGSKGDIGLQPGLVRFASNNGHRPLPDRWSVRCRQQTSKMQWAKPERKSRSRTTLNSTPMIAQPDNNGPPWFTKRDRCLMQGLLLQGCVDSDYRRAGTIRTFARRLNRESIAASISGVRLVDVRSPVDPLQPAMRRPL
jgi:hypothetical protein